MNTDKNNFFSNSSLLTGGIVLNEETRERLRAHCALIREWNEYAGLVSRSEVEALEANHVVDSLSLAPIVSRLTEGRGELLDIGSGGGFPALPLKILFPMLQVVLVERSERKVGFLRGAVGSLALEGVEIVRGEFPAAVADRSPRLITARAVERPEQVYKRVIAFLPEGSSFLCQSGVSIRFSRSFHVEHVRDVWSEQGWRRGDLDIITRVGEA